MPVNRSKILIIGYGEMGHAMRVLLSARHDLTFYDAVPREGLTPAKLEDEAARADFILLCVPTQPHQELLETLAPHLRPESVCLSIAKGLDDMGRTPAQIYTEVFGRQHPYCLLYGPMISEEIRAGCDGFGDLWCSDVSVRMKMHGLFRDSRLHLRECEDITGMSWAVILKNVYAMAFGMADELQLGDNVRGFLAVAALQELAAIVQDMGGDPATPLHLAGLGDLITTATSAGSHHHELGRKLARGDRTDISGEGVHTLAMVEKYQLFDASPYPLFGLIHDAVKTSENVAETFRTFLD